MDDNGFWKLIEANIDTFPIEEILNTIKKELEDEFENDANVLEMAKELATDKALMRERFILEAYVYLNKNKS